MSSSAIVTKVILNYTRREAHLHPIVDDWIDEKVHSHDAAAATAFLPQWSQSVHTGPATVAPTVQ